MLEREQVLECRGSNLFAEDGSKLGTIVDIYLDQKTESSRMGLSQLGSHGGRNNFVPVKEASAKGSYILVSYSKDHVKSAPSIDADGELSPQEEAELYRHYGLDYSEQSSDSGFPEGHMYTDPSDRDRPEGYNTSGPTADDAMTRSEEELRIRKIPKERVRLSKDTITEEQQFYEQVRKEQIEEPEVNS
jgi:hypothetical protein